MGPTSRLQAHRATLNDLPPELFLEIISYLDNASLIQFSLICKRTHQIGLLTFFSRSKLRDPRGDLLSVYDPPIETLQALRVALFVKRFRMITYSFVSGAARTVHDIRHLTCLVQRLSYGLSRVELTFTQNTRAHDLEANGIDGKAWFERLTRLFDAALEKGCLYLKLDGGKGITDLYRQVAPDYQLNDGGQQQESTIDPVNRNCLAQMRIFSDMALYGPFYAWMLSTLRGASSTLTMLNMHLTNVPTASWGSFMRSLRLPKLRHLELVKFSSDRVDCSLPFSDLQFFLSRHSSITNLIITGLQVLPAASEPPKLPQLKSITAASGHLSWIIGSGQNPCLTEVKNPNLDKKHTFKDIDDIFEVTLPLRGPIALCLFLPRQPGLEEWLLRPGVVASLTCVSTLDLSTASGLRFTPGAFMALPGWLGLFPRLTFLKIYLFSQAEREALEDQGMMRRMAMACKDLNTLQSLSRTFDLSRFRDDAGECSSSPSSQAP